MPVSSKNWTSHTLLITVEFVLPSEKAFPDSFRKLNKIWKFWKSQVLKYSQEMLEIARCFKNISKGACQ